MPDDHGAVAKLNWTVFALCGAGKPPCAWTCCPGRDRRGATSMGLGDFVQLALGLLIPPPPGVPSSGVSRRCAFGRISRQLRLVLCSYAGKQMPLHGLEQVLVVSAAWIHGCLGMNVWLRMRPWWPTAAGMVYPLVFLLPILALLGFVEAGKEAIRSSTAATRFGRRRWRPPQRILRPSRRSSWGFRISSSLPTGLRSHWRSGFTSLGLIGGDRRVRG